MNQIFRVLICIVCVMWSAGYANQSVTVHNVRLSHEAEQTRLVLELSEAIHYQELKLQEPLRLVLDFEEAVSNYPFNQSMLEDTPILSVRSAQQPNGRTRIVFDLKPETTTRVFQLDADQQMPQRLVIDFNNSTLASSTSSTTQHVDLPEQLRPHQTEKTLEQITEKLVPKLTLDHNIKNARDVVVVIDPGHGGHDPGAHGPKGTLEKNVVLAISHELAKAINQTPGIRAELTRSNDTFIPLRGRLKLARKGKADMFIAIHADAFKNPKSSGASVFALSQKGASSEAARWLAEKENVSELGGTTVSDKNPLLFSVLLDLSQTGTIRESLNLGGDILQEIGKMTKLHQPHVEQAQFVVLKSPDIPSLLIETGFISNPEEEQKLSDKKYQAKLAQAILTGIKQYFILNPPPDSYFALAQRNSSTHIVKAGETLASIAKKYRSSEEQLSKFNRAQSGQLTIGQVLHIPPSNIRI